MSTHHSPSQANANDLLGYDIYAQTLWSRIVAALDKDRLHSEQKLGDDPLVVGIFGEWGAGKSKLLSLIQEHAVKDAQVKTGWRKLDGGNCSLTVPVFFQPWKYEHEEHLHVPILLHILAALEEELKNSQTWTEVFLQSLPNGVKDHLTKVVGAFGALLAGVAVVMDTQVPLLSRLGLGVAGFGSTLLKSSTVNQDDKKLADTVEFKANGRFFYEMHQTLQAITRPGKYAKQLTGVSLSTQVSINFVLFVDDLDRCLPEKAVATLELIKTIFNLESFAFVLALDEEVVERGIGHRYRDYALANKKPEMPITGFEYLEKIVHLPFRLPALTAEQARDFVEQYEQETVLDANLHWFNVRPSKQADPASGVIDASPLRNKETNGEAPQIDLLKLAISGFDAYVPRKLVRLVELMQQIAAIASERGKPLSRSSQSGLDARVVLALVMIQLFQPEMYRFMRRQKQAFPFLLAAFADRGKGQHDIESHEISDFDLWQWVAPKDEDAPEFGGSALIDKVAQATAEAVHRIGLHKEKSGMDRAAKAGVSVLNATAQSLGLGGAILKPSSIIANAENRTWRTHAQHVRLPIVAQIVEHRSAQRHVFNVLKLMQNLAQELEAHKVSPLELKIDEYFSFLGQDVKTAAPAASQATVGSDSRPRQRIADVSKLFAELISDKQEVQVNLATSNELQAGHALDQVSAQMLLATLVQWGASEKDNEAAIKVRLLQGLRYFAPFIPREDSKDFWNLVADTEGYAPPSGEIGAEVFTDKETIARRELWADVRSTLGQDPRFDAARVYLPKERRAGHTEAQEPIPGFVRIPAGTYQLGASGKGFEDNPPYDAKLAHDYFMARHLTTVDQYTAFIGAKGYDDDKLWDSLGWQWRTGAWDSQVKEESNREHLASRKPELRHQPMQWDEQRAYSSRPVMQLNWFEARAYCRWLDAQVQREYRSEIDSMLRRFYAGQSTKSLQIMLPTEMQWERAARAMNATACDTRQYPWGGDEQSSAHLCANLSTTGLGRASTVGLFQPNPLGIADLAGNLWEWQMDLHIPGNDGASTNQSKPDFGVVASRRGGSCASGANLSYASFPGKASAEHFATILGFRVVLSLA